MEFPNRSSIELATVESRYDDLVGLGIFSFVLVHMFALYITNPIVTCYLSAYLVWIGSVWFKKEKKRTVLVWTKNLKSSQIEL